MVTWIPLLIIKQKPRRNQPSLRLQPPLRHQPQLRHQTPLRHQPLIRHQLWHQPLLRHQPPFLFKSNFVIQKNIFEHISTQAENDDQQMISRKLLSFQRTVSRKNNQKMNSEKLTWNLFKTISVPVVSPENCISLVNGICVVQRDESDSGESVSSDYSSDDSVSSQTMAVATTIIFLTTISLWISL